MNTATPRQMNLYMSNQRKFRIFNRKEPADNSKEPAVSFEKIAWTDQQLLEVDTSSDF